METMEFTVRITCKLSLFKTFIKEETNVQDVNEFIYRYIDKDCEPLIPCDYTELKVGEERGLIFFFPVPKTPVQSLSPKYKTYVDIIRTK